jgi:hypothetical protein
MDVKQRPMSTLFTSSITHKHHKHAPRSKYTACAHTAGVRLYMAATQRAPVNGCEAAPNVNLVHVWHDSADLLERARRLLALGCAVDARSVHRLQRAAFERLLVMHLSHQSRQIM